VRILVWSFRSRHPGNYVLGIPICKAVRLHSFEKFRVICVLLTKNTKYVWLDAPPLAVVRFGIIGADDIDDAAGGRVQHLGFNATQ